MMEDFRESGGVKHTRSQNATGLAKVIPKNSTKCSLIFNCAHQNACDPRRPKFIRLPTVENIGAIMALCSEKG